MIAVESELRGWGRSLGIVVPREAVLKEKLKAGDTVKLVILKTSNALKDTFGRLKLKRSTDEILKEIDETAWKE
jgi:antitoxin component of MazEF toxin-antitoxin module